MAAVKFNRITAALIGAAIGFAVALLLALSGHPLWFVLPMLIVAIAPSVLFAVKRIPQLHALRQRCRVMPWWGRLAIVLLLVGASLAVKAVFDFNPRDYAYMPLLPAVLIVAVLFGFGTGLLAVIVSTISADFLFALPEYHFALTEWRDALGLATFGIIGALGALAVEEFLNFREPRD